MMRMPRKQVGKDATVNHHHPQIRALPVHRPHPALQIQLPPALMMKKRSRLLKVPISHFYVDKVI